MVSVKLSYVTLSCGIAWRLLFDNRLHNSRLWTFSEGAKRRKRPHSPSPFLHSLQTFRSNMDAPSLTVARVRKKRLFCSLVRQKNSGLNFRKFPITNGTTFSPVSGKEDNIARYTEIFPNFYQAVFIAFDFPSRIFGWIVWILEMQFSSYPFHIRKLLRKVERGSTLSNKFWLVHR